ncbi:MAG: rod shape-determining protein MreC [Cyclobacteriaceae bacterium]|nr:rod shape-determining protein MreC [Cyclobacteriaceae bacterium]MDW8331857.1 rod shape-determining protein MreC [Cyclobacteriaceae bacterium]
MQRILLFIYQYRAFFTFLFLELISVALYVQNNSYTGARFFNSTNRLAVAINNFTYSIRDYFALRDINRTLAEENRLLREQLQQYRQGLLYARDPVIDSVRIHQYQFTSARVISNSVGRFTNFITIDRGLNDGVEPGMAVISPEGIVGKVKVSGNRFSVVTSLLNVDVMVSARLKRTGHFGTVQWDGVDPDYIPFKYLPRHVQPVVGDSIVTTGYSGIFPEDLMIGTIAEIQLAQGAPFYTIRVKLAQDFRRLSYVQVIRNRLLPEIDSLELRVPDFNQ